MSVLTRPYIVWETMGFLITGFPKFCSPQKDKVRQEIIQVRKSDRAPLSLWVRHEKSREQAAAPDVVIIDKRGVLCWAKEIITWSLQWESRWQLNLTNTQQGLNNSYP